MPEFNLRICLAEGLGVLNWLDLKRPISKYVEHPY